MALALDAQRHLRDDLRLLAMSATLDGARVAKLLGGEGVWSGMPEIREVEEAGGPGYQVLTGEYETAAASWESHPIAAGTPLAPPKPLFAKLDTSVVDEELARLEQL